MNAGLGDAPRHAALGRVADLAGDDQPVGLVEQAAGGGAHHERRHQVLEHRPGPRDQRRAAADRRQRPTEPEPVVGARRRPWRSPGSWSAAPPRRAGRSSSDRARPSRTRKPIENSLRVGSNRKLKSISATSRCAWSAIACSRRTRSPPAAWPARGRGSVAGRVGQLGERRAGAAAGERAAAARGRGDGCRRSPGRPRPTSRSRSSTARPALGGERRGDVRQRPSLRRRARRDAPPRRRPTSRRAVAARARRAPRARCRPSSGLASADRRRPRPRLASQRRSRRRSRPARRSTGSGWSIIWRQALDSGEQVAGEVAAVDRRHVLGLEPLQVARVVPVVEVAAEPFEPTDRRQRRLEPLDHLERADPAEVAGA